MTKQKQRKLHHWPEGWLVRCTPAHTGTAGQSKENTYAILRLDGTGYHSDELWSYPAGKILITFPLYTSVHQITYLLNVTFCRWPDFMSLTLLVNQELSGMLDKKINIITRNQSIELYIYKNRIEFEKFDFIFFQCWVLLIKYFNFNSLLLLHGVWNKIKRSTMKFILNFIFFIVV